MPKSNFKAVAFLILATITLSSCTFNSTYKDREGDKNEAEAITNQYYTALKAHDYEGACKFFSPEFWKVTPKAKAMEIFRMTQQKLGELQSTKLHHWETTVIKGTNASSEYIMYYLNQYKNFPAKETLRLLKDDNGKIQIVAFNINSDGFFK